MSHSSPLKRQLLRALPGGVFLLSAGLKLFDTAAFELYLFSFGLFSFDLSSLLARLLIGIELLLGLGLLLGWRERLTASSALTLLLLFSGWLLWRISLGDEENCHCMGTLLPFTPEESLLKNLALIPPLLYLLLRPHQALWQPSKGWRFSIGVALLLLPLIISPPDAILRLGKSSTEIEQESLQELLSEEGIQLGSGRHALLFLSTECTHCQRMIHKIGSTLRRHRLESKPLYALFLATSEEMNEPVEAFFRTGGIEIERWSAPHPRLLLKACQGALPLILFLEEGVVVAQYDYLTLTEEALCEFLAPQR